MGSESSFAGSGLVSRIRYILRSREIFIHDGAAMRRVHISTKTQMGGAALGVMVAVGAVVSLGQLAISAVHLGNGASDFASRRAQIAAMEDRVEALQADVAAVKASAQQHAATLEARQAILASILKGEGDPTRLSALIPASLPSSDAATKEIASAFAPLNQNQLTMAAQLQHSMDARYAQTADSLARYGFAPTRISGQETSGVGGPFEPVPASEPQTTTPAPANADPQFRDLFNSWKRLDQLQTGMIAIPSQRPVGTAIQFTSSFGVRADPFNGQRAMHAGVDIAGPLGTPIYATADAIVGRTGWAGGYGNLVELEHGRGIQTRYGHLSQILVAPGTRIKRGQLIALMGSTGRSTGNHLHYEVRIDGKAVSPIPFLQGADYLLSMQQRRALPPVAMGGPVETGK
jgi:murein DD-endopeptidase MepM/ murein hydrolase activator NlpD